MNFERILLGFILVGIWAILRLRRAHPKLEKLRNPPDPQNLAQLQANLIGSLDRVQYNLSLGLTRLQDLDLRTALITAGLLGIILGF